MAWPSLRGSLASRLKANSRSFISMTVTLNTATSVLSLETHPCQRTRHPFPMSDNNHGCQYGGLLYILYRGTRWRLSSFVLWPYSCYLYSASAHWSFRSDYYEPFFNTWHLSLWIQASRKDDDIHVKLTCLYKQLTPFGDLCEHLTLTLVEVISGHCVLARHSLFFQMK